MDPTDLIVELQKVDTSETWLWEHYPEAFVALLKDHTTGSNIYWATDSYESYGEGYRYFDELTVDKIIGDNETIVQPRAYKDKAEQTRRCKDKGEVFTPTWVCNAQNNLIDNEWFGRPDVFNTEYVDDKGKNCWKVSNAPIEFLKKRTSGKTWQHYVKSPRLEITCGEAPYLASRYDTTTGLFIPLEERIGLLDRKLRVVSENTKTESTWFKWAIHALESTYGYEWQGDSLLIAREALLVTVLEWHYHRFGRLLVDRKKVENFAYRISWNIWQMDGLKYGLPGYDPTEQIPGQGKSSLDFGDDYKETDYEKDPRLRLCRIKDWALQDELQDRKNKKKDPSAQSLLDAQVFKIIFKSLLSD